MKNEIEDRIFIVGCPRSGTTLLQSIVASHPEVISFPESHFFEYLYFNHFPLGIINKKPKQKLIEFFESTDYLNLGEVSFPLEEIKGFVADKRLAQRFIDFLDSKAMSQDKRKWVEKTPNHIICIEYIKKLVPQSKFIHIIRSGKDVIASLYDASYKYPESTWQVFRNIDRCIKTWQRYTEISLMFSNHEDHLLISYEDLSSDPKIEAIKICNFLGVSYNSLMLQRYSEVSMNLVTKKEEWKNNVVNPIQSANNKKFLKVFTLEEQLYIQNKLVRSQENKHISALRRKFQNPFRAYLNFLRCL